MNRPTTKSPFSLPTLEQLTVFERTKDPRDGPSFDRYRPDERPLQLDVRDGPRSVWNLAATKGFVNAYITLDDAQSTNKAVVSKIFTTYHQSLKRQWQNLNRTQLSGRMQATLVSREESNKKHNRRADVRIIVTLFRFSLLIGFFSLLDDVLWGHVWQIAFMVIEGDGLTYWRFVETRHIVMMR